MCVLVFQMKTIVKTTERVSHTDLTILLCVFWVIYCFLLQKTWWIIVRANIMYKFVFGSKSKVRYMRLYAYKQEPLIKINNTFSTPNIVLNFLIWYTWLKMSNIYFLDAIFFKVITSVSKRIQLYILFAISCRRCVYWTSAGFTWLMSSGESELLLG